MDDSLGTLLTANVKPVFYTAGTSALGYTFTGLPLVSGIYASTPAVWQAILNAGSYTLLLTDTAATGSQTKYPTLVTVTVPGTNATTETTNLNPYLTHMQERATPSLTAVMWDYNTTDSSYDISTPGFNFTTYSKFEVDFTLTLKGSTDYFDGGNAYICVGFPSGWTIIGASLDGVTAAVLSQTTASVDGLTGYYLVFPTWSGGTRQTMSFWLQKVGTPTAGTITFDLHDNEACYLATDRWWTDTTYSIQVSAT
jgi:hypothetical protein